jgi:hypothetical protein
MVYPISWTRSPKLKVSINSSSYYQYTSVYRVGAPIPAGLVIENGIFIFALPHLGRAVGV